MYKIVIGNGHLSNGAGKLAELDTTILRYNREYPLAHRFFWRDHRLGEVTEEVKTKQDGPFTQLSNYSIYVKYIS